MYGSVDGLAREKKTWMGSLPVLGADVHGLHSESGYRICC